MKYPKPKLDRETAMKLWLEERSEYAKEQVVLNNIGIVGIVLKQLNLNTIDEDFLQLGVMGIVKAVNTFDSEKGLKFSTYASRIVRNEILMFLRKKRIIPSFSLDEEFPIGNGDSVPYSEMISSNERFEELSDSKIYLDMVFDKLSERDRKIAILSMRGGETE